MCVVSMIMDHYGDKWRDRIGPYTAPYPYQPYTPQTTDDWKDIVEKAFQQFTQREPRISDDEIREFRQLLERAREYDKRNNEPECELEEKKEAVRQVAKQLGVEITFL
jgi:hypothetical protein